MRINLSLLTAAALTIGLATSASAEINPPQISGVVTAFDGRYDLHVRTADGADHDVHLHPGTDIEPTGITLKPGMKVAISGAQAVDAFSAATIQTNYHRVNSNSTVTASTLSWGGISFPPAASWQTHDVFVQDDNR